MKLFTRLFTDLDTTNKTSEKVEAMERYFKEAAPVDAAWGLFFLMGNRLKRVLKTSIVREAVLQATDLPNWMLGECYEAVGDLSETISLLLPASDAGLDEPLHTVVESRIIPMTTMEDPAAVESLLQSWAPMSRAESFVFNKLIRGNFRVGVQRALVVRALSSVLGLDTGTLTHRLSGTFYPSADAYLNLSAPSSPADDAARPYPFCLAHALERPIETLGDPQHWLYEHKWDGIRAQVVRRLELPAGVALWSRGEEPIANQFPEIAAAAARLPAGTVLDGEILAWRFGSGAGRALSFNTLQTRLNRKDVQPTLFDAEGVVFLAFDLLEHEGRDIREQPLHQRRETLERLLSGKQPGPIMPAAAFFPRNWKEVELARASARESHNAEGIMLKPRDSRYHVGRVAGGTADTLGPDAGWWKWKVNPYSVDAVLIYAQQGSGRRAGLFTDYTFGVWDPDPSGELTPFAKAYSGLDNAEIQRVDRFIRTNTIDRAGPVRMVRPELVFEISFEAIRASTRHRSGIAVRFPRITRWRTDKSAKDADTIGTVRALLAAANARD